VKRGDNVPNKITQILLTTRNSSWGVMVNPVATNTYQHILSWESEELKDWFINKYLFNDENFDYKSKIKEMPNKPLSIISDTKCVFKVDTKDYDLPMYELRQKDLAIILEADCEFDENGKPFNYQNEKYTFWALSEISAPVGHIVQYTGELDIFFTYNIKDMFNSTKQVKVSRAHTNRYIKDGDVYIPNITRESVGNFPEDIDNNFDFTFIPNKPLYQHEDIYIYALTNMSSFKELSIVIPLSYTAADISYYMKLRKWKKESYTQQYLMQPYNIIEIEHSWSKLLAHSPYTYSVMVLPCKLQRPSNEGVYGNEIEYSATVGNEENWKKYWLKYYFDTGSLSINVKTNYPILVTKEFADIDEVFKWEYEGKIYRSPYYKNELIDLEGNNYVIDNNILDNLDSFDMKIEEAINTEAASVTYRIITDYTNKSNIQNDIFGLQTEYNTNMSKVVNGFDNYMAYNSAQFNNAKKNAKRHQTQSIIKGALGVVGGVITEGLSVASMALTGGLVGAGGISSGINTITNSGIEIANSKEELNGVLAQQKDLQNQPVEISNSSPYATMLTNIKYDKVITSDNEPPEINNYNRRFFEIWEKVPPNIVREKLAFYFHTAGVNFAGTFQNINELISSRYYFNYIQLSSSVFENIIETLDLSQNIRNIIDSSLSKGLTVWHIRDKGKFKGIKYYNVNNVEMEFIDGN
jgi:hypothetical protein